jgi:hypothetical protein
MKGVTIKKEITDVLRRLVRGRNAQAATGQDKKRNSDNRYKDFALKAEKRY